MVLFGKLAEVAGEYLRKGAQVYIEGQLRTRSWEDNGKGVGLLQNLVVHALPVTVTVSPQVVADWQHSTCWQSVTSFRLTGLSA
uniref:Single-stranded DNA-binding protein n=1 Tax=Escherichia coli TaxID=562 RepID=A0A811ART9_ECOLX|nr:hypothetical protein [Escherichia coli]